MPIWKRDIELYIQIFSGKCTQGGNARMAESAANADFALHMQNVGAERATEVTLPRLNKVTTTLQAGATRVAGA